MNSTLRLPLVALALACVVAPTAAQQPASGRFAFFSGVSIERGHRHNGLGLQVGGLVNVGLAPRLGMQLDVTLQTFRQAGGLVYSPCPPPSVGPPTCGAWTKYAPLTVASATANIKYSGGSFHWLAGVGVYDVAQSPTDGSYARAGWNLGGGFRLGHRAFLDVRYHQLIRPETSRSFVPITFGVRF